jgi:hypothetical protein
MVYINIWIANTYVTNMKLVRNNYVIDTTVISFIVLV